MMPWLAIVVVLGLNVQADAQQQDAQARPSSPHPIKGVQADHQAEQLYRALVVGEPQTVFPDH